MYYQIKGLVLEARVNGEADKTATVYSYQWGKIYLQFAGAKKINAKLAAAAEPLTESEFLVCQKHPNVRPKAVGAKIINNHSEIKSNFKKNLYALYASEISAKLTPNNVENVQKYLLISRIWEVLQTSKSPKLALSAFVLRFLKLSGYGFGDFLKQNAGFLSPADQNEINQLGRCSGNDIDDLNLDGEKIWKYIETYLLNYINRPRVGVFIEKLGNERERKGKKGEQKGTTGNDHGERP
ncbi:MAG: DNA repair protein RecO [Elusimicrobiota bacterium]|jgi:DNA repair protein RecO (recombination protein O)|nr:DNA repair protein RecO [Elusimicrobiota bacterium]